MRQILDFPLTTTFVGIIGLCSIAVMPFAEHITAQNIFLELYCLDAYYAALPTSSAPTEKLVVRKHTCAD